MEDIQLSQQVHDDDSDPLLNEVKCGATPESQNQANEQTSVQSSFITQYPFISVGMSFVGIFITLNYTDNVQGMREAVVDKVTSLDPLT